MEGNTGAIIRIIYIKQLKHYKMHNQEIFTNTRSWPNGNHFCLHQIIYLDLLKICIFLNYICANVMYCAEVVHVQIKNLGHQTGGLGAFLNVVKYSVPVTWEPIEADVKRKTFPRGAAHQNLSLSLSLSLCCHV